VRGLGHFKRSTAPSNGMDARRSAGAPLSSPAAAQRCAEGAGLDRGVLAQHNPLPSIAAAAAMTADMISTRAAAFDGPSATTRIYTRLTDVTEISGPLAALKVAFPTARHLVFGWGARDYYMAQNPGIADLLRAAVPGPAVMLVIPLQASPEAVFGASTAFSIPAPQEGIQRLSQFLWDYLAADEQGSPRRVGIGPYQQSVFYASAGTYNLGHICNTWTAEALGVAGFPVTASGVVFAGQVLDQLPPVLEPVTNAHKCLVHIFGFAHNSNNYGTALHG
jgi:hypothetical protein